jgi:hypothetical protein
LNNATTFLFRILSVLNDEWHPDAKLPELTRDDLEKTILDADAAIKNLIDTNDRAKDLEAAKKGIIHKLGKGAKTFAFTPFLNPFGLLCSGLSLLIDVSFSLFAEAKFYLLDI